MLTRSMSRPTPAWKTTKASYPANPVPGLTESTSFQLSTASAASSALSVVFLGGL